MNKEKVIGIILIILALPIILYSFWLFLGAFILYIGGPDPSPSTIDSARSSGLLYLLIGFGVMIFGVLIGKIGVRMLKPQ